MPVDTITLRPGDLVTYEDIANPIETFEVIERVEDRWGTFFRLTPIGERWDSVVDLKNSDCRQYGWNLVKGDPA